MPVQYNLVQKVKLAVGAGCVKDLAAQAKELGHKKALVVCDPGTVAVGLISKVTDALAGEGIEFYVYDKVEPEPPYTIAEEGIKVFKQEGADFVIGVGGGSSIDCSKAINALRYNDPPILQYADFVNHPLNLSPGLFVVPTTAGTGSELSDGIVLCDDDGNKIGMLAIPAMAEYAFIDPELYAGMPPGLTVATGLDAFSHASEGIMTTIRNPVSDLINEKILETVVEYLPKAVKDGQDLEARTKMALSASMAGWQLAYSHSNAGHSIAHVIGKWYKIPHGLACAYATPWVMEFCAPVVPDRVQWVGELLGVKFSGNETPEEIGAAVREAYIKWANEDLGLRPATTFDIDKSLFPKVAEDIKNEFFQLFQQPPMSAADAEVILGKIFA
jgi:alcohol dehydrogenase class IV